MKKAELLLRIAIGLPFIWFGIDKLIRPDYWLSYMPLWASAMAGKYLYPFMYLQGAVEAILGASVVLRFYIRPALLLIGLILISIIATTVQLTELGIRDISLLLAAVGLWYLLRERNRHGNL